MNYEQYRMWFMANCVSEELANDIRGVNGLDTEMELESIIKEAYAKHCRLEAYYNTGKWE
jgi:hypothetical protein